MLIDAAPDRAASALNGTLLSGNTRNRRGSTTLPMVSIYSAAAVGPSIREVGIYNSTTTQVDVSLRLLTTRGTVGAAVDAFGWDQNKASPSASVFQAHSSTAPTMTTGFLRRTILGAAYGAGVIWTFGRSGLVIPEGTAHGLAIVCGSGTSQLCYVEITWDE